MFAETATAPPPGGTWPNEPASFTVENDEPFNALTENGWDQVFNTHMSIVQDGTGPLSPPNVIQWFYPIGFQDGGAPGTEYRHLAITPRPTELYVGFWWKMSNPWQQHSSGFSKIAFIYMTDNNHSFVNLRGTSSNWHIEIQTNFDGLGSFNRPPNVTSTYVTAGQWHRIEFYFKSGTASNGIVRWWVDGVLNGSYANINYSVPTFEEVTFSPTWGGVTPEQKTENDYFWVDHIHISTP